MCKFQNTVLTSNEQKLQFDEIAAHLFLSYLHDVLTLFSCVPPKNVVSALKIS